MSHSPTSNALADSGSNPAATGDGPSALRAGDAPGNGFVRHNDLLIAVDYLPLLQAGGLDSLDALFAARDATTLGKPGLDAWRERLRLDLNAPNGPRTVYLKRFTHPPRSARRDARRSGCGAQSVAGVEWAWMRRLAALGVPCPAPIALGEEMPGHRRERSAVLMTAVPGTSLESLLARAPRSDGYDNEMENSVRTSVASSDSERSRGLKPAARDEAGSRGLKPAARDQGHSRGLKPAAWDEAGSRRLKPAARAETVASSMLDRRWLRALFEPSAAMVARLHAAGLVHRDLYLSHLFCDPAAPSEASLHLIDLQRVMRPGCCFNRWRVKDLAALNYSAPAAWLTRTDRLRWLKSYLRSAKLEDAGRRLAWKVMGKTLRMARHDRRRLARLAAGSGSG